MLPANLRLRLDLMQQIRHYIGHAQLTQAEAALRFGVPQPRISEIVQGKYELFTVDKLVNLLERVGQHVEVLCHNESELEHDETA
jgi:predicted XRE-type DNA-binding protein